ncbi:MAG: DinB family protein [Bacteroidetes bacterium]|nr:DinB family protein [Bacteroidota bacterium]
MNLKTKNPLYVRVENLLLQLKGLLLNVSNNQYIQPIGIMDNATIGQHTRHILELFQVLINGHYCGAVNYDERPRDLELESNPHVALSFIDEILANITKNDKTIIMIHTVLIGMDTTSFDTLSSYRRELAYNIEHTIHHLALIKVAIRIISPEHEFDTDFGYADSTLINKKAIHTTPAIS